MTSTIAAPRRGAGVLDSNDVRVEGRDKVSGKMKYTADVKQPGMLQAAFTTSPIAHGKIISIDTSEARRVPGVHAVLTSADLPPGRRSGRVLYDLPVLAYDRVLYIGDRVAAVAAETREAAEEAARLVEVEYEDLPALLDPFAAVADDAPVLHPDLATYFYNGKNPPRRVHPNIQGSELIVKGEADLEAVFARAHRVYEHKFLTPRQHAGYIEPHATTVSIDGDGVVHVWTVNKQPFAVRQWMSNVIGVPLEKIIVESAAIGGDFGGKGLTIDEYVCYYLSKATSRPVRHVYTYVEELQASSVRHQAYITLRTAVDEHGRFIAHESNVVYDGGAYAAGKPSPNLLPGGVGYATVGYDIPNVRLDMRCVYTNTIPGAHVRSPADVQVFFGWEQHVELIAADLGIDSLELRMLNVVRSTGDTALTGETFHNPQGYAVLEALKHEIEARPPQPGGAWGTAIVCRHTGGGKTAIDATLQPNGIVEIVCGVPDQGSGAYTVAQRVFAERFGVGLEYVRARGGSTHDAKQDPGSGGSRVTYIVGNAAAICADLLAEEIKLRTGYTVRDGDFVDAEGAKVPYVQGVAAATKGDAIHVVGSFDGTKHDADHPADFSFSAFAFDVAVDRETGGVTYRDGVLVAEVGKIINPVAHQGQLDGGFVYGFGSATMEEMPIDENGKLTSLSLGDYKIPTIKDIPPMRTILVRAPAAGGPYGSKMAGELSNSGVGPAIVNAVANAAGVRIQEFPITAERIYTALNSVTAG